MPSLKRIIKSKFDHLISILTTAAAWSQITEKDLAEGYEKERELAKNIKAITAKSMDVGLASQAILSKYREHHSESNVPGTAYGSNEWFQAMRKKISSSSDRKPFDDRQKTYEEIEILQKERSELTKSLKVSAQKIESDINSIKNHALSMLGCIKLIEEKGISLNDAKKFSKEIIEWADIMAEHAEKLAESEKNIESESLNVPLFEKDILENIRAGAMILHEEKTLDDAILSNINQEIEQIKKDKSLKKTSAFQGYNIWCTNRAKRRFKNSSLMDLFKNRFARIASRWEGIKSSDPKGAWHYIWPSEVARGELSDSARIIYEIKGNIIYVYDLCFHPEYESILPLLKNGKYKAMKSPVSPLEEFYEFEAAA